MTTKNIIITDILELGDINNNTPIIIIKNIPYEYLTNIYNNIYWIDTSKLYNKLEPQYDFISNFIPVGQIKTNKKYITSIFANVKIIPTTKTFEKLKNNDWIAIIKKNNTINRSIGTFKNIDKPNVNIPVFPQNFLQKYINTSYNKNNYKDLYSHKKYGKWTLNKYMFNIDKSNLKMIDSTGNISNMYIPTTNNSIFNNDIANDTFFSVHGNISNDDKYEIQGRYENESLNNFDVLYNKKIKNNKMVLKEKINPWFLDYDIVGDAINTRLPHKVTGITSTDLSITNKDNNIYTNNDAKRNEKHNNYIIIIVCILVFLFTVVKLIKNN